MDCGKKKIKKNMQVWRHENKKRPALSRKRRICLCVAQFSLKYVYSTNERKSDGGLF